MMLKTVFLSTLISSITLNQVTTEKIDFKKIFHTPKDYDKLEILERSSFEPDDPVEPEKLGKNPQPKAFANAQVLVNFDNEETAEGNRDKRSQYPYASFYPLHPFPIHPPFHSPLYSYPYHPHHSGCFFIPPCFPQQYFHQFPQYPIDVRMNPEKPVYEKRKSDEEKIEDCLNGDFKVLTSKEPINCVGCSPNLTDGKFPADVDSLMMNQSSEGLEESSSCPDCGGGKNVGGCPTCAKYTKELNDLFSS